VLSQNQTKSYHSRVRTSLALLLLVTLPGQSFGNECSPEPVKPAECVCGSVINPAGELVANAKVTVLQGTTELASMQTGPDGKFSFEHLQAGNYEIRAKAEYYQTTRSAVVLRNPSKNPKRVLQVVLAFGMACVAGTSVVKRRN
jgi:hypothetical protein